MADHQGRKWVFYMGVFMHLMLIGCTFLVEDAKWFYCVVFLMGIE